MRPPGGKKLEPGNWHDLMGDWDCVKRECRVMMDGQRVAMLPLAPVTPAGMNYLRLRSMAQKTDSAGFLMTDVEVDVW